MIALSLRQASRGVLAPDGAENHSARSELKDNDRAGINNIQHPAQYIQPYAARPSVFIFRRRLRSALLSLRSPSEDSSSSSFAS